MALAYATGAATGPPQARNATPCHYIAKGNGIASNGLKIALWHKRQKPAQGLAGAGNAYEIGTKKPAQGGLSCFGYVIAPMW